TICLRDYTRFFRLLFFFAPFFRGTFAPFFRASDRPIAIACLRLLTVPPFPPLPLFNVPFLRRRIALSTRLLAALPYFLPPDRFFRPPDFFAAMSPPHECGETQPWGRVQDAFQRRQL